MSTEPPSISPDELKRAAAIRALDFVEPGMRLGLGTGSTARHFVELLGARVRDGLDVVGVPTSEATRADAEKFGVPLTTLDETPELDLTVDGADEIGPGLAVIKGGGGALLREKIVASASRRMIVIADYSKAVPVLGRFPLPVEVVPFGLAATCRRSRRRSGRPAAPAPWCCGATRRAILSSPMAGTSSSTRRSARSPIRLAWHRTSPPSPAWSSTGSSSAWCGSRSSPGSRACASSNYETSGGEFHGAETIRALRPCRVLHVRVLHRRRRACPGPAPAPSAGAVAAARELIVVKGGAAMFEPVIPGVIETAKNSLVPTNPNLTKELNDVAAQLRKDYDGKKAELVYEVALIYAKHFTEQELKDLVAFYKSPLGQKMLKEEPLALDQGMKRAQDWSQEFSEAVLVRIRSEMTKKGHPL